MWGPLLMWGLPAAVFTGGLLAGVSIRAVKPQRSFSPLVAFVLVSIISFAAGLPVPLLFQFLLDRAFVHDVQLTRDVDLVADHFFQGFTPDVQGYLKRGSVAKSTFRKGAAEYVEFSVVLNSNVLEPLK